jgi:hypothetical protein
MKQLIEWVIQSPLVTRISGIANTFGGPVGGMLGFSSTMRSMEKKSNIYWNAGMSETEANALAAADTLHEGALSLFSFKSNPVTKGITSFVRWVTKDNLKKTNAEQTLETFYASRKSAINIKNPTVSTYKGEPYSLKGNFELDQLYDVQKDFAGIGVNEGEVYLDSGGVLKGRVNENHYLPEFEGSPTGQAAPIINNGLSNSAGVSDQLITVPQNVPSFNFEELAAFGKLGQTGGSVFGAIMGLVTNIGMIAAGAALGGTIGNAMKPGVATGVGTSITDMPYWLDTSAIILHNGGQVPGQGEVPAILKGGETVRTKAQEEELKQKLYDRYVGNFIPTACGASTQPKRQQENTPAQNKPIHQQITKDDEVFILNIIYDAIERNRIGLRHLVQAV